MVSAESFGSSESRPSRYEGQDVRSQASYASRNDAGAPGPDRPAGHQDLCAYEEGRDAVQLDLAR